MKKFFDTIVSSVITIGIVVGGLFLITSLGAIIGLLVALVCFALIVFVIYCIVHYAVTESDDSDEQPPIGG